MNKFNHPISQILVAGAAGVTLFSFANAPVAAALRGDMILGIGASAALLAFAAFDYSRRSRPLTRLPRPTLPTASRANSCDRDYSGKDCLAA